MTSLLTFTKEYSLITILLTLILGIVGNSLNILIFTKLKIFQNNQCIFYLLAESIVNLIAVIFYFTVRMLSYRYGSDFSAYYLPWCKMKIIIVQTILLAPLFIVCFAAIDQFLSTSYYVFIRHMSSLKLARRLVVFAVGFSLGHSIGFGMFFYARPPLDCIVSHPILTGYYSFFFYPFFSGFLPLFIAGLFSVLAFRNVRRIIRWQLPIVRRRLDRQLTKFVLIRVTFLIILLVPFVIYRAYTVNTTVIQKTPLRLAIENLLFSTLGSIFNLNYAVKIHQNFFKGRRNKCSAVLGEFLYFLRIVSTISSTSEVCSSETMWEIMETMDVS